MLLKAIEGNKPIMTLHHNFNQSTILMQGSHKENAPFQKEISYGLVIK